MHLFRSGLFEEESVNDGVWKGPPAGSGEKLMPGESCVCLELGFSKNER
jgi:hypothetical protein